jgi:hypothetical protein
MGQRVGTPRPVARAKTLLRRIVNRIAAPYVQTMETRFSWLSSDLDAARGDLREARKDLARALDALRAVYDEEPANRRRLHAMRRDPSYEQAYREREPLVSFVIPTYDSFETLTEVCLPSILGQTYPNLEVIVIGDGAPHETAAAIAQIDDPRVTYFNRAYRGPYPAAGHERWLVSGTPAFNEGLFRARGRWIAPMDDDDAVRPDHTHALIEAAQRHGYELCYGRQAIHFEDGAVLELGEFPPRYAAFGLQAAVYHSGLGFIGSELVDAVFREPNDWSLCRRMLRIGVYAGMIDRVVVDKNETRSSLHNYLLQRATPH